MPVVGRRRVASMDRGADAHRGPARRDFHARVRPAMRDTRPRASTVRRWPRSTAEIAHTEVLGPQCLARSRPIRPTVLAGAIPTPRRGLARTARGRARQPARPGRRDRPQPEQHETRLAGAGFRSGMRGCGGRIRTADLRVMSPTSYHCSTPRPPMVVVVPDSVKLRQARRFMIERTTSSATIATICAPRTIRLTSIAGSHRTLPSRMT